MTTMLCAESYNSCQSQEQTNYRGDEPTTRSQQRQPWSQYFLKPEKLPYSYGHPYPKVRAYDRCGDRCIVIEMIPRDCVLKSIFPLSKSNFLRKIKLTHHPFLVGLQDTFYCPEFGCQCLVYECPNEAQTLGQVLNRGRRLDAREARIVFTQVIMGVKYLLDNGLKMEEVTVDDLLFWEEESSGRSRIRIQIMYLKFTHARIRSGFYGVLEPPDTIFPQFKSTQDSTESQRLVWHLGVLLFQTCTNCKLQPICNQKEYMGMLEDMRGCIFDDKMWESKEQQKLMAGLTAFHVVQRWSLNDLFNHPWVCFGTHVEAEILGQNVPEFLMCVQRQLTKCVLDHKNCSYGVHEIVDFNKKYVVPALGELVSLCYERNADEASKLTVSDKIQTRSEIWQKRKIMLGVQKTLLRFSNSQNQSTNRDFCRAKTENWQFRSLDLEQIQNSDINQNTRQDEFQNLSLDLDSRTRENSSCTMISQLPVTQSKFPANLHRQEKISQNFSLSNFREVLLSQNKIVEKFSEDFYSQEKNSNLNCFKFQTQQNSRFKSQFSQTSCLLQQNYIIENWKYENFQVIQNQNKLDKGSNLDAIQIAQQFDPQQLQKPSLNQQFSNQIQNFDKNDQNYDSIQNQSFNSNSNSNLNLCLEKNFSQSCELLPSKTYQNSCLPNLNHIDEYGVNLSCLQNEGLNLDLNLNCSIEGNFVPSIQSVSSCRSSVEGDLMQTCDLQKNKNQSLGFYWDSQLYENVQNNNNFVPCQIQLPKKKQKTTFWFVRIFICLCWFKKPLEE